MIITPNCQLFLDFQNNVIDKGLGGLTWNEVGGSSVYGDIDNLRAIQFNSGRYLSAGKNVNPYSIENEYTLLFKIHGDSGGTILDLGSYFTSGTGGSGLSFQISGTGGIMPRIEQKTASGYNGGNNGRWASEVFPAPNEWNVIVVRRKVDFADVTKLSASGADYNSIAFSSTALDNWDNRTYAISALFAGVGDGFWDAYDLDVNKLGFWNLYLNDSDLSRIMHGMHPLNG